MSAPCHRVFVYGLLRRGDSAHTLLERAEYADDARTAPLYALLDLGGTALVEGGNTSVIGEVYLVDDDTLAGLDLFEEAPTLYERRPVALAGGATAEAYFICRPPLDGVPILSGGLATSINRGQDCLTHWPLCTTPRSR